MKIKFTERAMPLYPELRIIFRISQIILILSLCSQQNKASLIKLHLFNWALYSPTGRLKLLKLANGSSNDIDLWSIDPILNQAINLAVADGIIERISSKYQLSNKGKDLFKKIEDEEIMKNEIEYLHSIDKKITESLIDSIVKKWK